MRIKISEKTRLLVAQRAGFTCEYCRTHEDDMFLAFEIDHIVALKHGGGNDLNNLAYACPHCNQHKGSDIATFLDDFETIIPLFNPRKHDWNEHFTVESGKIESLTSIGRATIKILNLNDVDLIILRQLLMKAGRYPFFLNNPKSTIKNPK